MNGTRHTSALSVLMPIIAALASTAGVLYEHSLRKSLFSGVVSGKLYFPRELDGRFRVLSVDEVASLTQCFLLLRTEAGDAAPGWIPPARLQITYDSGHTKQFWFYPEKRLWESLATGRTGVWQLSPDIDRAYSPLSLEEPAESDFDNQKR